MSTQVVETQDSRAIAKDGGENRCTRRFHVWDDSSAITSTEQVFFLFGTAGLPNYGDPYPGASLMAVNPSVSRAEGQNDLYLVEWTYADISPGGEQGQVLTPGYVEINTSVGGEFEPMWRAVSMVQLGNLVASGGNYAFGSPQSPNPPDISGTPIDWAGEPTSFKRRTRKLVLGVTMNVRPRDGDWEQFTFRRNNTPFNGYAAGAVVYVGAEITRLAPAIWRASHTFVRDQFFHMHQTAYRLPDGKVAINPATGKAESVHYVQPFPDFANFYAIDPNFAGIV